MNIFIDTNVVLENSKLFLRSLCFLCEIKKLSARDNNKSGELKVER